MKTVEEFIQRLQDDPAFEKQAHAFDNGDDLIAFVKRQGYDFTLEQLTRGFEREEKPAAATDDPEPPPADISAAPPLRPDEPEFPRQPEVLVSPESPTSRLETWDNDLTPEQVPEELSQPTEAMLLRPDEPEFPRQPEVLVSPESAADQPRRGSDDFSRKPPRERLPQPEETMPPTEAEEEPRAGLFRGGGGRHRGFSPQRLKSLSGEDP